MTLLRAFVIRALVHRKPRINETFCKKPVKTHLYLSTEKCIDSKRPIKSTEKELLNTLDNH